MTAIVGLFENTRDADKTIDDLTTMGLRKEDIGLMAQQKTLDQSTKKNDAVGTSAGVGATSGTALGGVAGLLVGIGALAIPGLGPVIAAGTLGTVIGTTALGAGIGAAAGSIVGALTGMGLSEEDAHFYSEGVKRGGILVTAQANDTQVQQISDTMRQNNAIDVNTRRQQYQNEGWSKFDHTNDMPPHNPSTGAATY